MSATISTNESKVPIDLVPSAAIGNTSVSYDNSSSELLGSPGRSLAIIDARALDRECLAQSISAHKVGMEVLAFGSIDEWRLRQREYAPLSAILLNVGGRKITDEDVAEEIRKLSTEFATTPVIVLADTNELAQIMKALEYGARGYIPSSVGIDVCVEAIKLALAGGIFVPASSVFAMRQLLDSGSGTGRPVFSMFTDRQAEVVEALRRGKPNKIIAFELNLRESTVKVHIRNIMKKIKATNRTEVVYKINALFA
jgi:DNA-binding NarL/FixJ family response regulator